MFLRRNSLSPLTPLLVLLLLPTLALALKCYASEQTCLPKIDLSVEARKADTSGQILKAVNDCVSKFGAGYEECDDATQDFCASYFMYSPVTGITLWPFGCGDICTSHPKFRCNRLGVLPIIMVEQVPALDPPNSTGLIVIGCRGDMCNPYYYHYHPPWDDMNDDMKAALAHTTMYGDASNSQAAPSGAAGSLLVAVVGAIAVTWLGC